MSGPLVVLDADVLGRRRTGDETYVANLLRTLPGLAPDLRIAAVTRHPELVAPGAEAVLLPARSRLLRMGWTLPRLLRRMKPALAHFQYVIPPGFSGPSVVTVHDLSFTRRPDEAGRPDRFLMRPLVPRALKRAARVLTVSEWSRADLLDRYGLPPEKVVVAPNGLDPAFGPDGDRAPGPPYLLFVGALQPRKDPITAVRTLAQLDGDLRLVMVGPEKLPMPELHETIDRLGLRDRVTMKGYVDTAELAALYRGAECLVFPSNYEGFGLPVIEAMASGTPVVAADATAVPEIAGGAAVLVPLADPEAMAAGVREAISRRDELVAAGFERAAHYRWEATAARVLEVYRELVTTS